MCNVWRLESRKHSELTCDEYGGVFNELATLGTKVLTLSGGEPLLRKDIFGIVAEAKNHGFYVQLITNGVLLTKQAAEGLIDAGLDSITFSLDSPEPTIHDEIRGVKGTWEKTIEGIKHISQARSKARHIEICVFYVLTSRNYHLLGKMGDFKRKLGYDTIHFLPIIPKTERAKPFLLSETDLDDFKVNYLPQLKAKMKDLGLSQSSFSSLERIANNREYSMQGKYAVPMRGEILCFWPWQMATIDPFGNVYPCCYACTFQNLSEELTSGFWGSEDFNMGNLREKSFKEIWNGTRYIELREKCKKHPLPFPFCVNCDYSGDYDLFLTALFKSRKLLPIFIRNFPSMF